jgi:alkanesulfonate monooxygenase SsuD/methylene tetrahydromethanopterin reductase-like flavin-dependent oxidoreductase (luciferase family)
MIVLGIMVGKETDKLGALDAKLLELAASGKSPDEISRELNRVVSPERAAQKIKELLASRTDYLSIREQQALVLFDLHSAKEKLWEMLDGYDGVEAAGPLIRTLKIIGDRVDAQLKQADDKTALITKAQAEGFVKALEIVYERVVERLEIKYPEIEAHGIRDMVNEELPVAFEHVNRMTEEPE